MVLNIRGIGGTAAAHVPAQVMFRRVLWNFAYGLSVSWWVVFSHMIRPVDSWNLSSLATWKTGRRDLKTVCSHWNRHARVLFLLVGGLEHLLVSHILGIIIPTD